MVEYWDWNLIYQTSTTWHQEQTQGLPDWHCSKDGKKDKIDEGTQLKSNQRSYDLFLVTPIVREVYKGDTLTKQESSFFHKRKITWWNYLTQEHLKQQMNPWLKPQRGSVPLRHSDQGHNLPLYPVDLLMNSRAQWYRTTLLWPISEPRTGVFIGHKPSGGLLRPGLKPLHGPQVQLEQMEFGTLAAL